MVKAMFRCQLPSPREKALQMLPAYEGNQFVHRGGSTLLSDNCHLEKRMHAEMHAQRKRRLGQERTRKEE